MDFTGKVCKNCEESLQMLTATTNPNCIPCALADPRNKQIEDLKADLEKLRLEFESSKSKENLLYEQNIRLLNVNIEIQNKASEDRQLAKSEALALKDKINQLENTANANAGAGGLGNAEANMEVEGPRKTSKRIMLGNRRRSAIAADGRATPFIETTDKQRPGCKRTET